MTSHFAAVVFIHPARRPENCSWEVSDAFNSRCGFAEETVG
jgi:hypothetical protein